MDTNDTIHVPTEFNVHALASAIVDGSLAVRMTAGVHRQIHASRLAGLIEAWALLTHPSDELRAIVKRGPEGGRDFMSAVEVEAIGIAARDNYLAVVAAETAEEN